MASYPPPDQQPYYEEPPPPGMSAGTIVAIVAAILFVVVGIPLLSCAGFFALGTYSVNRAAKQLDEEINADFDNEITGPNYETMSEREARELEALKVRLKPVLYEHAKDDLRTYWTNFPTRGGKWKGWYVEQVDQQTFAILGRFETGAAVHQWRCDYSTSNPFNASRSDWRTERVIVNDELFFKRDDNL